MLTLFFNHCATRKSNREPRFPSPGSKAVCSALGLALRGARKLTRSPWSGRTGMLRTIVCLCAAVALAAGQTTRAAATTTTTPQPVPIFLDQQTATTGAFRQMRQGLVWQVRLTFLPHALHATGRRKCDPSACLRFHACLPATCSWDPCMHAFQTARSRKWAPLVPAETDQSSDACIKAAGPLPLFLMPAFSLHAHACLSWWALLSAAPPVRACVCALRSCGFCSFFLLSSSSVIQSMTSSP